MVGNEGAPFGSEDEENPWDPYLPLICMQSSSSQMCRSTFLTSLSLQPWPRAGAGLCWDPGLPEGSSSERLLPYLSHLPHPHPPSRALCQRLLRGIGTGLGILSYQVGIRDRCGLEL